MERPFTVYFDTNFFIWLCGADEMLAKETINNLNTLRVRHVLSDVLFRELLSSKGRTAYDQTLVGRVKQLEIPPYCTSNYLTWDALLYSGLERNSIADLFKLLDKLLTKAHSHSIVARRIANEGLDANRLSELEKSMEPFLKENGFSLKPEDKEENLKSAQVFTEKMINFLKEVIPNPPFSGELKFSDDPTENSKMLFGLLNPKDIEAIREENRLHDSVTYSEDRPYKVASGIADDNTETNLGNTLRDTERMKTFILHKDEIDLLQVDKAQMNIITAKSSKHRIADLGLSNRCFSAHSLSEVIETIRRIRG
jgi:hypothetical protein